MVALASFSRCGFFIFPLFYFISHAFCAFFRNIPRGFGDFARFYRDFSALNSRRDPLLAAFFWQIKDIKKIDGVWVCTEMRFRKGKFGGYERKRMTDGAARQKRRGNTKNAPFSRAFPALAIQSGGVLYLNHGRRRNFTPRRSSSTAGRTDRNTHYEEHEHEHGKRHLHARRQA